MDDTFEKALLILFGWLLGLLAPVVTKTIQTARESAVGRMAIRSELRDVAHKLALTYDVVKLHLGECSRSDVEWLKQHLEAMATFEDSKASMEYVRVAVASSDEVLAAMFALRAAKEGETLGLQKYPVPLLDSRVSALHSFDSQLQRQLLEIRTLLSMLDRNVDMHDKYVDRTFTTQPAENSRRNNDNIRKALQQYAKTARRIVDLVGTIERG